MQFESWSEFVAMGGYGLYVWTAFGISIAAIGLILIDGIMAKGRLFTQVIQEADRKNRIKQAKAKSENSRGDV